MNTTISVIDRCKRVCHIFLELKEADEVPDLRTFVDHLQRFLNGDRALTVNHDILKKWNERATEENCGELVYHIVLFFDLFVAIMDRLTVSSGVSTTDGDTFFRQLQRHCDRDHEMLERLAVLESEMVKVRSVNEVLQNDLNYLSANEAEIQAACWVDYSRECVLQQLKQMMCPESKNLKFPDMAKCKCWSDMFRTFGTRSEVRTSMHLAAHTLFGVSGEEWEQLSGVFYRRRSRSVHQIRVPAAETIGLLRFLTKRYSEADRQLLRRLIEKADEHRSQLVV
jgi:hypothetical protein